MMFLYDVESIQVEVKNQTEQLPAVRHENFTLMEEKSAVASHFLLDTRAAIL